MNKLVFLVPHLKGFSYLEIFEVRVCRGRKYMLQRVFFAIFQAKSLIWVCNFIIYNTDYWIHSHSIFFSQCFFSCQKRKSLSSRIQKIGNRQLTIICFNFWWFGSRLFLIFFSVQKSVSSSKVIKGFFLAKGVVAKLCFFLNAHSLPLNCKIGKKENMDFQFCFVLEKWKFFISISGKSSLSMT